MRQHRHRKTIGTVGVRSTSAAAKTVYRVRNWRDYNKALVRRYDITIWFEEDTRQAWLHPGPRQQGAQFRFRHDRSITFLFSELACAA